MGSSGLPQGQGLCPAAADLGSAACGINPFQLIWWLSTQGGRALNSAAQDSFRLIFTVETELGVFTTDLLSLLLLFLLPDNSCLFFVPVRSVLWRPVQGQPL